MALNVDLQMLSVRSLRRPEDLLSAVGLQCGMLPEYLPQKFGWPVSPGCKKHSDSFCGAGNKELVDSPVGDCGVQRCGSIAPGGAVNPLIYDIYNIEPPSTPK